MRISKSLMMVAILAIASIAEARPLPFFTCHRITDLEIECTSKFAWPHRTTWVLCNNNPNGEDDCEVADRGKDGITTYFRYNRNDHNPKFVLMKVFFDKTAWTLTKRIILNKPFSYTLTPEQFTPTIETKEQ